MNFKKLSLGLIACALTSNIANADYYFRFFGGDTLSSLKYEADAFNGGAGGNLGNIEHKAVNTVNIFNSGFGAGVTKYAHPKIEVGLQLDGLIQTQKYKFNQPLDSAETAFQDAGTTQLEIENKYKGILSLVMKVNKAFYVKAGPSLLRQKISTKNFGTNITVPSFTNSETENLFGGTIGTGFIYKLTKRFGLFTEYNYSYYPEKKLKTIVLADAQINPPGGVIQQDFVYGNRKIDFSQSEFIFGFVFNFDFYSTPGCSKSGGSCSFEK